MIKEISLKYALSPITFIHDNFMAYIYSVSQSADSYLLSIDLNKLEFKDAVKIGGPMKSFGALWHETWTYGWSESTMQQILNSDMIEAKYNLLKDLSDIITQPSKNTIYILNKNTDAISVYDIAQQKIIKKITGLTGAEYFILSKNQKYLIVITMTEIMLVNTDTDKVDYRDVVNGTKILGMQGGRIARTINPSFNPDGNLLFVEKLKSALSFSFIFSVIDLNTGKKVDEIPAKTWDLDPYFYWI